MKYSLMSLVLGNLIKVTKPSFIQLRMAKAMGLEKEDPTLEDIAEFMKGRGMPYKEGTMSFEDCVKFAKESGYDGFDLMSYHFEIDGDEARAILEKYGITMSGICIIVDFANATTPAAFTKCFDYAKEILDRVAKAGCKNVLLMPCMMSLDAGVSREAGYQNMLKGLKACMAYGEPLGLTFNMETLNSIATPLCSAGEILRILGDCPTLKYAHDTGNLLSMCEDPAEMYEMFKDKVQTVHFKDFNWTDGGRAGIAANGKKIGGSLINAGLVDFEEQLRLLSRDGYDKFILLEGTTQSTGDTLADAAASVKYFRELEAKVLG